MISFVSLMWAAAVFFAFTGALRGWRREVIGLSAALLGSFALLQFDSLLRGSVYRLLSDELTFLLQMAIFLAIVIRAYRSEFATRQANGRRQDSQTPWGGAAVGFCNGYVIAGAAWYFPGYQPLSLRAIAVGADGRLGEFSRPRQHADALAGAAGICWRLSCLSFWRLSFLFYESMLTLLDRERDVAVPPIAAGTTHSFHRHRRRRPVRHRPDSAGARLPH